MKIIVIKDFLEFEKGDELIFSHKGGNSSNQHMYVCIERGIEISEKGLKPYSDCWIRSPLKTQLLSWQDPRIKPEEGDDIIVKFDENHRGFLTTYAENPHFDNTLNKCSMWAKI